MKCERKVPVSPPSPWQLIILFFINFRLNIPDSLFCIQRLVLLFWFIVYFCSTQKYWNKKPFYIPNFIFKESECDFSLWVDDAKNSPFTKSSVCNNLRKLNENINFKLTRSKEIAISAWLWTLKYLMKHYSHNYSQVIPQFSKY